MYSHNRILLFGHDDMLLKTRGWILEKAGFQVWIAYNLTTAAETIVVEQIDAMVLCQTLSTGERWEAMTMGEALRPEMKVLVMEDEYARLPADKTAPVLQAITDPVGLIAAVRKMTDRGMATQKQA